jgi:hypothetical protein
VSRDTHTDDTLPTVVTDSALSHEEQADLARLTRIVRKGAKTFIETGNALMEICQRELYRETHDTFAVFCEETFGFKKSHAYRLISAAKVVADHPEIDFASEREVRQFLQGKKEAADGDNGDNFADGDGECLPSSPGSQRRGMGGGVDRHGELHADWTPADVVRYEDMLALAGEGSMTEALRTQVAALPESRQRLARELAIRDLERSDAPGSHPARLWSGIMSRVKVANPTGGVKCADHELNFIQGLKKLITSAGKVDVAAMSKSGRIRMEKILVDAMAELASHPVLSKVAKEALRHG